MKEYLSITRSSGEVGYFTYECDNLEFVAGSTWYDDDHQLEYYTHHNPLYTIKYFDSEESMIAEVCLDII